MLTYRRDLKEKSRQLRCQATESEGQLWTRLRRKQLLGIQFYRQKPIGNYIVDFYAPKAKLIVEVDGSQHRESRHHDQDEARDAYLAGLGMRVLRFNSREVLLETDAVVEVIYRRLCERMRNPP